VSRSYAFLIGSLAAIWGALFYGWLLLNEQITAATVAGLVLILGGVALGSGAVGLSRRAPAIAEP
jgi:drug/metabolite transporter (DMT)-like permease